MLRRFQASSGLLVCLLSIPAAADEPADEPAAEAPPTAQPPPAPEATAAVPDGQKPVAEPGGSWHVVGGGYFRAPMAIGVSSRPGPDNMTGPSSAQYSYGPNRTVDANYYSFAYTRLQEQDWAEVFIHAKKEHVDAAVGWMGYWFQAVGFRNPDAAWAPGLAYLKLDTDFAVATDVKPNIALTMGAFWPSYGYFEKYDTYTLGRSRQLGEELKLTVPFTPDVTLTVADGFGTGRDGSWNSGAPPFYGAITAIDLLTWANAQVAYQKYVDVAVHYSTQWTADPNLTQQPTMGDKSYAAVKAAHLTVVGGEANVRIPKLGHLWVSPSFVSIRNGWALASAGTEVMHALGGYGVATNYLAYTNNTAASTGSGSMVNFGVLYENTLSGVLGRPRSVPDVSLSIFALLADAKLDLPANSPLPQKTIKELKYGADVTLQTLTWLAFMLRFDGVNYDRDNPGYVFASITPRAIISSHFLSNERIYLQYSRYFYGDKMVLGGTWPWGAPLVAGNNVLQAGPYAGLKPDANVVKLQADIAF